MEKARKPKTPGDEKAKTIAPVKLYSELVPIIETLFEAAKQGDASAAATLIEGAEIMSRFVESLFRDSPEIVRPIAGEKGFWPCVVSPRRGEHGGPDWVPIYLNELQLGASLNESPRKDQRTSRERIAVTHLRRIGEQLSGKRFLRGGIANRDKWFASEHGKDARKAIQQGLDYFYEGDTWQDSLSLAPIVEKARQKVRDEQVRVRGIERAQATNLDMGAVKTALIELACFSIHGRLRD